MTQSVPAPAKSSAPPPPAKPGIRLLPVLALMLGLVLTIRVGDVWQGLTVGVGTETQAQTPPAATTPAANAPAATTPPPATGTQSAATAGGAATDEAATEADAAAATAEAKDPLDLTDEEVDVLQQLAKRREELDLRARQLDEREAIVQAAEQRMEQKMAELKALQTTVEDLLKKRSDQEEQRLQTLVQTYEKMKPKDAAQVFEEMDMDLLRDLVSRMKTSRAAPILALVSPTKVKELTLELADEQALPFAP